MLAIVDTHPVQYRAPIYRYLAGQLGIPLTVIYGSDFSVTGYRDAEFGTSFKWDIDLLAGYDSLFLGRAQEGGPADKSQITGQGLSKTLASLNPKAVLSIGYSHPLDRAGLWAAFRHHWPLLFRSETTDQALSRSALKGFVRDTALRTLYKRCAHLLYIGENSRTHYQRLGVPENRLLFSPYCVDTAPFQCSPQDRTRLRTETRHDLKIDMDRSVIIYSGKLTHRKGVDLLLNAVKCWPNSLRDNTTLLFLGSGAEEEPLISLADEEPSVDTRFVGFQNQTRLSPYYNAADLMTLPSRRSETWGLVVNEALSHGLPCVVSENVGSHRDLVTPGKTGEVFPTGNVSAYAEALQRCRAYAASNSTDENCRARAGKYSVARAAEAIAQAYLDIPGTRPSKT